MALNGYVFTALALVAACMAATAFELRASLVFTGLALGCEIAAVVCFLRGSRAGGSKTS